jgi:S1-C subfamily serine protease
MSGISAWGKVAAVAALSLAAAVPARADAPPAEARALSRTFQAVVRAVSPSVVRVDDARGAGAGFSGLVIDTAGNVVTTADAVAEPRALSVTFGDGKTRAARVVGLDRLNRIAVLRVDVAPTDLDAARFADSDAVDVGQWAVVIGRPRGVDLTVSAGIITSRPTPTRRSSITVARGDRGWLETDAKVAEGGFGGPLANLDGEVIALSTSDGDSSTAAMVPINQVRRAAQMIIAEGETHYPYIGVALLDVQDLGPDERSQLGPLPPGRGAVVRRVWRGAPAARAGLRPGDVITTIDNRDTPAADDVVEMVSCRSVGERLTVGFVRNGQQRSAHVSLDALPPTTPSPRLKTSWVISAGAPSRIGGPQ